MPTAKPQAAPPAHLVIRHDGMGWPVGAVIPADALPKGGADHIELGAVAPTDAPVSHPVAAAAGPAPDGDAAGPLRAQVRDLQGQLAGAEDRAKKAEGEAERLKAENEKLWAEVESAAKAADLRQAAERQKALDGGPHHTPKR